MELLRYTKDDLAKLLPFPASDANKYTRGRLIAVVGSAAYPGAACLSARAAERMGAGYVEVVTDEEAFLPLYLASSSLVVRAWSRFKAATWPQARPAHPVAYLVGSGFDSADEASEQRCRLVLKRAKAPVVVDGGGLDALTSEKVSRVLSQRADDGLITVITPHMGEAARLAKPLGIPTDDPVELACALARVYQVVVLLKGPTSYVSDGQQAFVMDEGSAVLAKAGTGDVLSGMVAALLAQGLQPIDACMLAATLHAYAGSIAAKCLGEISVIASDVIGAISPAIDELNCGVEHA
ncbi:NAD(P)H-hydrate dehydratase [Adlercreutzia agrestimuris]|uniref:NAD(P)H-hydrate dehydratase n=1 Tax=Adlercreutzia agrestimuris TaxID=2941324 RepID=UPI00203BE825|nr:NAD(P)H-hydrate dehydratase [Adlercreutzia agrestimuris]